MSRVVVALGGNALLRRGEDGSIAVQRHNLGAAARAVVELIEDGHEIVLTHGNGPQVGYLAIEAEAAAEIVPLPPLDVLVAESQGQIGYLLAQAVTAELAAAGRPRDVVAVLSQTLVEPTDPAFERPTKFVGPMYDERTAARLAAEHGWHVAPDGRGWRRVVPSPHPTGIVEVGAIRRLVDDGCLVIASGGGGIPVVAERAGFRGVEAVVDKDLAAVVLARAVGADLLLLLTDVPAVQRDWGTPAARPIDRLSASDAARMAADGSLSEGSMGPKVLAAAEFAAGGGRAAIGALEQARRLALGVAGTQVWPDPPAPAARTL